VRFVDEPTQLEVRIDAGGTTVPLAFTWRGCRRAIASLGRQWEERGEAGLVRHFLVMIDGGDRFELVQNSETGRWRVVRAWERSPLV